MPSKKYIRLHSTSLSHNQQAETGAEDKKPYIEIPKNLIVAKGSVGLNDEIAVTRPFCDGISIVGWVDPKCLATMDSSPDAVSAKLQGMWSMASAKLTGKTALEGAAGAKFRYVRVGDYNTGKLRLGADAASTSVGVGKGKKLNKAGGFQLRLRFNPHRLGQDGHAALETTLGAVFNDDFVLDRWLAGARVPRMDVAVDLINLQVPDAILRVQEGDKWSAWFGRMGRVQTVSRLQQRNKNGKVPPFLRLYDKRQERCDEGKEPAFGAVPYARLERVLKQNKRPFVGLGKLGNPFSDVSIGHAGAVAHERGKEFLLFHGASRWLGLDAAGKLLPDEVRIQWKSAIYSGDASFWKPHQIWNGWATSLKEDGLWDWLVRASKAKAASSPT